ncbi:MAG: DUF3995 domain-containing protein [Hyphomicrobiaceae bacterium]|nr:DUF3995 domain-containing protein [Hyphomicrobiaceae bacterium]
MTALGLVLAAVVLVIALIHAYWAMGGVWPASSPQSLARAVVGERGITKMPLPAASFAVAAILAGISYLAVILAGVAPSPVSPSLTRMVASAVAFVFLARGIASYTSVMCRFFPEEPFATLDRRYYAPLCLMLGIAFVVLLLKGTA